MKKTELKLSIREFDTMEELSNEDRMLLDIGPYVANTHTETTETGTLMTKAYQYAHKKIKPKSIMGPGGFEPPSTGHFEPCFFLNGRTNL